MFNEEYNGVYLSGIYLSFVIIFPRALIPCVVQSAAITRNGPSPTGRHYWPMVLYSNRTTYLPQKYTRP